jgi:hypothetical protein
VLAERLGSQVRVASGPRSLGYLRPLCVSRSLRRSVFVLFALCDGFVCQRGAEVAAFTSRASAGR